MLKLNNGLSYIRTSYFLATAVLGFKSVDVKSWPMN